MRNLFAHVRHQRHEPCPLDGVFYRTLESCAVAAALPAKELALAGAHLLQALHVLIVDERRPRATFFGAKPTTIFASTTQLLANHCRISLSEPFAVNSGTVICSEP